MGIWERMQAAFGRSIARWPCVAVCADCLRPGEEVIDEGNFGDFGLCARCNEPVTSKDMAYFVRPQAGDAL